MTLIRSCVIPGCKVRTEVEPDAYACPDCRLALVRKLADIETYLTIVSSVPTRGPAVPHTKGFASTPPARLDVIAMLDPRTEINGPGQDDIDDEVPNVTADLDGWSRIVQEEHPEHPCGHGAWYLRSYCDWITRQPWCDEFATDVTRVHSALRNACQDTPDRSVGECITVTDQGECGGDVYPTQDRDGVRCSRCRRLYIGRDLIRLNAAQRGAA